MFLPTYSSELNPIERLWSVLKRKWVQNLQLYNYDFAKLRKSRSKENLKILTIAKLHETIGKLSGRIKILK